MTSSVTPSTRQKLYRFLLTKPEPVRELLRRLTEAEAEAMLDMLVQCDSRRIAGIERARLAAKPVSKPIAVEAVADVLDAEPAVDPLDHLFDRS